MIASWMIHTLVATLFITAAAAFADRIALLLGRSRRWIWTAALTASVVLPLAALVAPWGHPLITLVSHLPISDRLMFRILVLLAQDPGLVVNSTDTAGVLSWIAAKPDAPFSAMPTDMLLVSGWAMLCAVVVALLAWVQRWLRQHRSEWHATQVETLPVLVTPALGPAVIGLRHPVVLLPSWVLALPDAMRRMILQHESEHVAAGDSRLLAVAAGLVAIMPWNVLLWFQCHRLRAAVETDCDARMLAKGTDVRHYGEVLLQVAARGGRLPFYSPAFSISGSMLENRIVAMTTRPTRHCRARVAAMASAALFASVIAVEASSMRLPENGRLPLFLTRVLNGTLNMSVSLSAIPSGTSTLNLVTTTEQLSGNSNVSNPQSIVMPPIQFKLTIAGAHMVDSVIMLSPTSFTIEQPIRFVTQKSL